MSFLRMFQLFDKIFPVRDVRDIYPQSEVDALNRLKKHFISDRQLGSVPSNSEFPTRMNSADVFVYSIWMLSGMFALGLIVIPGLAFVFVGLPILLAELIVLIFDGVEEQDFSIGAVLKIDDSSAIFLGPLLEIHVLSFFVLCLFWSLPFIFVCRLFLYFKWQRSMTSREIALCLERVESLIQRGHRKTRN